MFASAFWDNCVDGRVHIPMPNRVVWEGSLGDGCMVYACACAQCPLMRVQQEDGFATCQVILPLQASTCTGN